MQCKIEGCGRAAMYKGLMLCQKHYFRIMRNGTSEILRVRKYRVANPAGYQKLSEPDHPLANVDGYVYEHRKVVYDRYGVALPNCEICGKPTNWETCHIDHKDDDVTNNLPGNLRPTCNVCNTRRNYPEQHTISGHYEITYDGETKTPSEWARDPRISLPHSCIRQRKRRGMSDYDCLFSPKITHTGKSLKANL